MEVIGKKNRTPLNPRRRELMFRVMDGQLTDKTILHFMYMLDRLTRCDEILAWLVNSRLTGKNFKAFIKENNFTPLTLAKYAIRMIVKDAEYRPILYGRDFR